MRLRSIVGVFVSLALAAPLCLGAESLIQVDREKLVSRGDLHFEAPAHRSEEGMPIGNGKMGTLVWTTPSSLRMQINRVDVFSVDGRTVSFPIVDSDYASGCGFVDINVASGGDDVFTTGTFKQHLSLYQGLMTAEGKGLTARAVAWPNGDVIAVEIDDQRNVPEPVNVDLRMLRFTIQRHTQRNWELTANHQVDYTTAEHSALSDLDVRGEYIVLKQQFRERGFYDSSAVAIGMQGRPSKARYLNESTVQISAPAQKGKFTILIASAASFDENVDTGELAINELKKAEPKEFAGLRQETADWWKNFWETSYVAMKSDSGQAEFVEGNYTYFQYIMGSTSRGDYPPRFGGLLFYTNGDMRRWGSQYWWANQGAYYNNIMATGRLELMDPMFKMYFNMREACAVAAEQQWGSKGIFIPEISWFNGPERLPDDIATELRELYLMRKPWEERSEKFKSYIDYRTRHASRWNFQMDGYWQDGHLIIPTKGQGIFGHCTHILASGTRVASLFYQRYLYSKDENWLREKAYPMIKGSAEFYRHFPNLVKEADGKYHIHHVNNGESNWDSSDTPSELGAMRTIFTMAINVSEQLGVDEDLRPKWREIVENLAPPGPGSGRRGTFDQMKQRIDSPTRAPGQQAQQQTRQPAQQTQQKGTRGGGRRGPRPYGAFVYGGAGAIEPIGPEPEIKSKFLGFNALGSFIDDRGIGGAKIFKNRMRLREGPGATDVEHIGGLSGGINNTMLSNTSETLRVFNEWPKDWDAAFRLLGHGAFVVSSAQVAGKIPLVEVESGAGGKCRLRNPWEGGEVTLFRNGQKAEDARGEVIEFETKQGEVVVVVPKGSKPEAVTVL